jgi:hypothetical protein
VSDVLSTTTFPIYSRFQAALMTEQRDFQHAFLRNFDELKITFFPESLNLAIEEYSASFSQRSFGWD